jgi:hypothetical protein
MMSIPKPEGMYGLIWTGTKIDDAAKTIEKRQKI